MDEDRIRQISLAGKIKKFHKDLRTECSNEEQNENRGIRLWKNHIEDRIKDDSYSEWMKELGQVHWKGAPDRNAWLKQAINSYYQEDDYQRIYDRIVRKSQVSQLNLEPPEFNQQNKINKIQILDVGSCYNPFKNLDAQWDVLAIDLTANMADQVYRCDFLTTPVTPFLGFNNKDTVETLPDSNFDVVVFCLLLEYLPTPKMRYMALEKAYRVLKPSGILTIITPDSNHQGKNQRQMKSWRAALSSLKFFRVSYDKLPHVHCLSYVKMADEALDHFFDKHTDELLKNISETDISNMHDLLFIPQDKNLGNINEEEKVEEMEEVKEEENKEQTKNFDLDESYMFDYLELDQ